MGPKSPAVISIGWNHSTYFRLKQNPSEPHGFLGAINNDYIYIYAWLYHSIYHDRLGGPSCFTIGFVFKCHFLRSWGHDTETLDFWLDTKSNHSFGASQEVHKTWLFFFWDGGGVARFFWQQRWSRPHYSKVSLPTAHDELIIGFTAVSCCMSSKVASKTRDANQWLAKPKDANQTHFDDISDKSSSHKSIHPNRTGCWLNQPIWKILVKMGIFPNFRGENRKYLKQPPRLSRMKFKVRYHGIQMGIENLISTYLTTQKQVHHTKLCFRNLKVPACRQHGLYTYYTKNNMHEITWNHNKSYLII